MPLHAFHLRFINVNPAMMVSFLVTKFKDGYGDVTFVESLMKIRQLAVKSLLKCVLFTISPSPIVHQEKCAKERLA